MVIHVILDVNMFTVENHIISTLEPFLNSSLAFPCGRFCCSSWIIACLHEFNSIQWHYKSHIRRRMCESVCVLKSKIRLQVQTITLTIHKRGDFVIKFISKYFIFEGILFDELWWRVDEVKTARSSVWTVMQSELICLLIELICALSLCTFCPSASSCKSSGPFNSITRCQHAPQRSTLLLNGTRGADLIVCDWNP